MKKAFPFKKRLSAVLAVVLATACFAGTVPANAAESGSYPINVSGSHGTFEEYMWHLADNSSGDTLSFNDENQPVVTKGEKSDTWLYTSLGSRRIELAAGNYQLSFSIKSSSQAYYIAGGFGFNSSGDANALVYENSAEGNVGTEWTAVTANFTVSGDYTSVEFRIILRGDAGTQITVKDLDVKAITEQVKTRNVATLDGWDHIDDNAVLSYNNPNADDCKIIVEDTGCNSNGTAHFYKHGMSGTELHLSQKISNSVISEYADGTVFIFEADVKNTPSNAEAMFVSLEGSQCEWQDGDSKILYLNDGSSYDWTHITRKINKTLDGDFYMTVRTGGYYVGDFYIDNIKMYAENDESKTNILSNSDFYKTEPVTTLDGWTDSDYGYNNPNKDYSYVAVASEGYSNPGSVHIYTNYSVNSAEGKRETAAIGYCLKNTVLGKTYILEAYIKGSTQNSGNPLSAELRFGAGTWSETGNSGLKFENISGSDWKKISYEFTVTVAGWTQISINAGGYSGVDCYIDDIKIYEKDGDGMNLISNGDFCETESVVSDTSAIDTSEYAATEFPGFDIGMIANEKVNAYVVPGGSYNGSTALKITAQGKEGYFQTAGDESEAFPEKIRKGKIAFVKGDIAIKASGYFKKLEGSDAEAEPKVWFGFGKEYTVKQGLLSEKVSSVGSSYNDESKRYAGESYTELDNGWVKFEMTVDDETLSKINTTLVDTERVRFMCGIDCDGDSNKSGNYYGEALFDDIKFEIISKYAPGDANGDNAIDIRDLVHMKKYAAGTVKFTEMTRGTWLSDIGYNESPSITNEMVSMRKYLIGATAEYGK